MHRALLAAAFLVCSVATASAQDAPPSVADPAKAQFDAAFDAMVRGDFAAAAIGFRGVVSTALDAELRGAAAQLGRLAEDYQRRGGRLSFERGPVAAVGAAEDDVKDAGRTSLIVTSTFAGLYTGIVATDLTDTDDPKVGTLIIAGATAGGLVGSLYGSRGRTITGGMADAYSLGLLVGVGNTLLLAGPVGLFDAVTNASEKTQLFVLGGVWGGAVGGLLLADQIRPTRAQVSVTGTFGIMGVASTLLGLAVIQPDDLGGDAFLTITAAGLDLSVAAGAGFAGKLDWSLSRARLVGLSAFLGALSGVGTSILLFADNDGDGDNAFRGAAAITFAGMWGGFWLGTHLTRNMAPDYRFRPKAGLDASLAPTVLRGSHGTSAPGLALTGAF